MIEVFDVVAARQALARRTVPCPGCGGPLRPWGRARARMVRDADGSELVVRPDRARCTRCQATHMLLDAALLPRRAYTARVIGQALLGAARGRGHRPIAAELAVPEDTVRSWLRRARRSAHQLWTIGVHAVEALIAAALTARNQLGPHEAELWSHIAVLTRGRLLAPSPAG